MSTYLEVLNAALGVGDGRLSRGEQGKSRKLYTSFPRARLCPNVASPWESNAQIGMFVSHSETRTRSFLCSHRYRVLASFWLTCTSCCDRIAHEDDHEYRYRFDTARGGVLTGIWSRLRKFRPVPVGYLWVRCQITTNLESCIIYRSFSILWSCQIFEALPLPWTRFTLSLLQSVFASKLST